MLQYRGAICQFAERVYGFLQGSFIVAFAAGVAVDDRILGQ